MVALTSGRLRGWVTHWLRAGKLRLAHASLRVKADNENFRDITFTFSAIALAAKLAGIDGKPTKEEFIAFRELFPMPASEHEKIHTLFELASSDNDSLDALHYARQMAGLFPNHKRMLTDILERLVKVAVSDGELVAKEEEMLRGIAKIFKVSRRELADMLSDTPPEREDPYFVLGVNPDWSDTDIKRAYHRLVREYHPDSVQSRGGSEEAILIAQRQIAVLNEAYGAIRELRTEAS